jgi:hypothetical protein
MTRRETHAVKARMPSPREFVPSMPSQKEMQELVDAQSELFKCFQRASQVWLNHLQAEASLAAEFSAKLMAARSLPQTATSVQEWTTRQMEIFAQDGKRLAHDGQKFMEVGARLSKRWLSAGDGAVPRA